MTAIEKNNSSARKSNKSDADLARFYDSKKDVDLYASNAHVPIDGPTTWIEVPTAMVSDVKKFVQKKRKSA